MTFKFIPTIWMLNISAINKLILLCIADFANEKGRCWPSFTTIAKKCGLSRSTVIRSVNNLIKLGFLKKDNSKSLSNNYTLSGVAVTPTSVREPPGSSTVTPGVVSERHQGSSTVTPQSIIESINKKQSEKKALTRKLKADALLVLDFLNEVCNKNFAADETNLGLIMARMKEGEGTNLEDCRSIIAKKRREWTGDPKSEVWLRPATIFRKSKFSQYKGELGK